MLKKISFALLGSAMFLSMASAALAADPLSGWAWSSNTGWLSFSSNDSNAGNGTVGGGPYGVSISTSTGSSIGTLSGYAWSPSVGWVSFNPADVSSCPSDASSTPLNGCVPSVNLTNGQVSGWARATAAEGRTDGWDGWVELSGASHSTGDATGNNGVTYVPSTGQFIGWAWGADVLGWLQFVNVTASSSQACGSACNGQASSTQQGQNPQNGGLSVSCNVPPVQSNLSAGGGTVSAASNAASASGGTGSYQYQWSNGTGWSGAWSSSPAATLSYGPSTSYSQVTYQPVVEAKDSAGDTAQATCGAVTQQAKAQPPANTPVLWINDPNNPNDQTLQSVHVRVGSSVTVGYDWPAGDACIGNYVQGSDQNAIISNLWTSGATIAGTSTTFNSLTPAGVYKIQMSCFQGSASRNTFMAALENLFAQGPSQTNSNPVEIDVTNPTFQEQ